MISTLGLRLETIFLHLDEYEKKLPQYPSKYSFNIPSIFLQYPLHIPSISPPHPLSKINSNTLPTAVVVR